MQRSPELEAVIRRLWNLFVAGDAEAMGNIFTADAGLRAILGAEEEWLVGSDIPRVLADRSAQMGVERVDFDRVEAFAHGDAGWAASMVTLHMRSGATHRSRNTVTFVIDAGVWRVVQLHTSIAVPNTETFGHEISAGLADLLAALDSRAGDSLVEVAGVGGTVTLMFTDIEDSTKISQTVGDAGWAEQIQDHLALVRNAVEGAGGTVVKTLGDGAMAAFAGAKQAVEAGVAIQRRMDGSDLRVRIGVHTGDAIGVGGDYVGVAVNKAARVASAGDGGEILVSSSTRELIGERDFEFGPERHVELKGLDGVHRVLPLRWDA